MRQFNRVKIEILSGFDYSYFHIFAWHLTKLKRITVKRITNKQLPLYVGMPQKIFYVISN